MSGFVETAERWSAMSNFAQAGEMIDVAIVFVFALPWYYKIPLFIVLFILILFICTFRYMRGASE